MRKGQKSVNFWSDEMLTTFCELFKLMLDPAALHDLFSLVNVLIFASFDNVEGFIWENVESV